MLLSQLLQLHLFRQFMVLLAVYNKVSNFALQLALPQPLLNVFVFPGLQLFLLFILAQLQVPDLINFIIGHSDSSLDLLCTLENHVDDFLGCLDRASFLLVAALHHFPGFLVLVLKLDQVVVADDLLHELLELVLYVFELVRVKGEVFEFLELFGLVLHRFDIELLVFFFTHLI